MLHTNLLVCLCLAMTVVSPYEYLDRKGRRRHLHPHLHSKRNVGEHLCPPSSLQHSYNWWLPIHSLQLHRNVPDTPSEQLLLHKELFSPKPCVMSTSAWQISWLHEDILKTTEHLYLGNWILAIMSSLNNSSKPFL